MFSFTRKAGLKATDCIYQLTKEGDGDIELFSYVLAVPMHKQKSFETALAGPQVNLQQFGRVLYYGAGQLTDAHVEAIVAEAAAA